MDPTPLRETSAYHRAQLLKTQAPEIYEELVTFHLCRPLDLDDNKLDELINGISKGRSSISSLTKSSLRRLASPLRTARSRSRGERKAQNTGAATVKPEMVSAISKLLVSLSSASELKVEGVFRKSGNCARTKELKQRILEDCSVDLAPYTTHDRATVVKQLLGDMPEPLLLAKHLEAFKQAIGLGPSGAETAEQRCLRVMQLLMLHLPDYNVLILKRLLGLLHSVAEESANLMDSDSLAKLFAPHLLCSKRVQLDPILFNRALQPATAVVKFMIENSVQIFHIPSEFSVDVNQFLRTATRQADEASGSCTPARRASVTVFSPSMTFSARFDSNEVTTEGEIDKLKAHIETRPEPERSKMLKQLREMAALRAAASSTPPPDTTPLKDCHQSVRSRSRSKSVGSSIKKRLPIFKGKRKHRAESLDLGGSLIAMNIDFEDSLSSNSVLVHDQPASSSAAERAEDPFPLGSPILPIDLRDDSDEDVTPPKIAHTEEPSEAAASLASAPSVRDQDQGSPAPSQGQTRADSPLPATENEREFLAAPDRQGRKLQRVLSPLQNTVLASPRSPAAHQSPQRCCSRSQEQRPRRKALQPGALSVETAL